MLNRKLLKFASIFYKLADLRGNLATRVMLSAVPAIVQRNIKKKYGDKADTDPDTALKMQEEIKEAIDRLVSKLSPTIISGALELLRYAPAVIADELKHSTQHRDIWREFLQKHNDDPASAYKMAEDSFNDPRQWDTAYGGPPWARYAKYNGLLDGALTIATKLGDQSRELIQEHGRLVWEGSKLQDDYYKACIDVSRYINFIDSLEHNTGSFFNKLQYKQDTANLSKKYDEPPESPGKYYQDLMNLTDSKELLDVDEILSVIAPFKKDLPDSIVAYLPKEIPHSDTAKNNISEVRFNRKVGKSPKQLLSIIDSATLKTNRQQDPYFGDPLLTIRDVIESKESIISKTHNIVWSFMELFEIPQNDRAALGDSLNNFHILNDNGKALCKKMYDAIIEKLNSSGITEEYIDSKVGVKENNYNFTDPRDYLQNPPDTFNPGENKPIEFDNFWNIVGSIIQKKDVPQYDMENAVDFFNNNYSGNYYKYKEDSKITGTFTNSKKNMFYMFIDNNIAEDTVYGLAKLALSCPQAAAVLVKNKSQETKIAIINMLHSFRQPVRQTVLDAFLQDSSPKVQQAAKALQAFQSKPQQKAAALNDICNKYAQISRLDLRIPPHRSPRSSL